MNLKELSRNLGLSQTTVSRALNGYPEVSEATRQRVEEAARAFNYRPNTRAKGLATGRAMAIGHVIPVSDRHEMVNPVFGDFITGASETYSARGYDLVMAMARSGDNESAYRALLAKGSIDGAVVHGPRQDDPRLAVLESLRLPFVVHGRATGHEAPYSYIDMNNRTAFETATRHLTDLGHKRIALVNGLGDMDFAIRRAEGYRAALRHAGVTPEDRFNHEGEMTESYGHRVAATLLDAPDPPTAFVVSSIIAAIGVRRAIHERGLVLGRDVSMVIHDDDLSYFRNEGSVPVFTAVRSSVRDAGRVAAQMLLDQIEGKAPFPATRLLEAQFIPGQSSGPAPA